MEKREGRQRAERSDKKIKVNLGYLRPVHEKLQKLAMGCGITKTELQAFFVELCLNNENIINYTQDHFKDTSHFCIIPSKVDGELRFVFVEKTSAKK